MQSNRFLCLAVSAIIFLAMASAPAHAAWTPRAYHPELNSGSDIANAPCLSADGLTIYFGRNTPSVGAVALYTATRPDLDSAFGPQTIVSELFHGKNINAPWLSADGLRLYYHEVMPPDDRGYIRMAVRSDPAQPWTVARTFTEIHSAGKYDVSPSLSGDELILAYQLETGIPDDARYICIATRSSVDEAFGAPSRVTELGPGVSSGPHLSPDGLQLYCTRYPIPANSGDIMLATRASTSEPFSSPVPFPPFNTVGLSEGSIAFTPDMKQICFSATYIVSPFTEGIYTSYWYEPQIGYDLLDSSYRAELVAAYGSATSGLLGTPWGMGFDGSGNLYVSNEGTYASLTDGTLHKITPAGEVTQFLSNLGNPVQMIWGGGTPYGDYLYLVDNFAPRGRILKVTSTGTKTTFCEPSNWPVAIEIDRTGTYGGLMYTSTSVYKKILSVSPSGAMSTFSSFIDGDEGAGIGGMKVAPAGPYGGLMYVLTDVRNPAHQGLYTFDALGNPTLLTSKFISGGVIEFDRTTLQYFGGGLFARGTLAGDVDTAASVFYVSPSGELTRFLQRKKPGQSPMAFAFGPDGGMYVTEYNGKYDTTIISRIMPAGPYLAALGNIRYAMIAKQEAIVDVEEAITREKLALKALAELGQTRGLSGAVRKGVMCAYMKVHVAKVQEETALRMLKQTLPLLDNAWDILIGQVAPGVERTGSMPTRPTPLKPCPHDKDR